MGMCGQICYEFVLWSTQNTHKHTFRTELTGRGLTFISRMEASVSTEKDVSQLPLLEEAPPREARVAADRVEAVLEPCEDATGGQCCLASQGHVAKSSLPSKTTPDRKSVV